MTLKRRKQNKPMSSRSTVYSLPKANRIVSKSRRNETFYYVWGKTPNGRNYIDGPYNTDSLAWEGGQLALDGDFRIIPLVNVGTLREATRVIKRMDLEETRSIEQSLRKARHQL